VHLTDHYQNAYVTPDIDHAIALLEAQFGGAAGKAMRIDVTQTVTTADGVGEGVMKLAFIQIGRLQYELIEPVSGNVALYKDAVSADQPMRFHHVAMRADDIDAVRAEAEKHGRKVVLSGENSGVRFLYIDARDALGHYLEYVQAPAAFWEAMEQAGR
jgi:hypothetical protein